MYPQQIACRLLGAALLGVSAIAVNAQTPPLAPDVHGTFTAPKTGYDYEKRDVMIPMRDGVKLHTVILVPKSALGKTAAPILLTRTPYNATALTTHTESAHLGSVLFG